MKTKILSILALLLTMTQGAWAQTTADIGRVIAADGKMYKTVTLANKVSTASGVVAYVGSSEVDRETGHKYLAISLADIGKGAYGGEGNNFESTSDNLATVLTWINGQSVTTNGHNRIDDAEHPALDLAYNYSTARPSGASIWFVASVGQWNMVVKGLTGSNTDLSESANSALAYDKVNVKIEAAGATGLISASAYNYVLANPYDKDYVWEYMAEGRVAHWLKSADWFAVRPIFSFLSATNGYVVEYNANGGSGAPAAQSKTHGTALTLSSTVPTRTGYTFAGWATSAEGAVEYSAGGSYTTDNDIVLYAQWTPTYTATFADGNDNTDWTITPASGVEGATVTVSYEGENKVKSVTVKGISAVTSAPTANDLTYTGAAQNLVTAGSATYGTMVYSLDGETYSAAIPTATNAGNYTVYYKVDGGTDYTGTTAQTVNVTITKVNGSLTVGTDNAILNPSTTYKEYSVTYSGGTLAVSDLSGNVSVTITNGGATSGNASKTATVRITRTDAKFNGDVTFSVTADGNHNTPSSENRSVVGGVALSASAIGDRVATDGYAYPAAERLTTVAGMVGRKSGSNGTVIAKSDATYNSSGEATIDNAAASSTINAYSPTVSGHAWTLSSTFNDYGYMFNSGNGGFSSWSNMQSALSTAGCTEFSDVYYWTLQYANGGNAGTWESVAWDANGARDCFYNGSWVVALNSADWVHFRYLFTF